MRGLSEIKDLKLIENRLENRIKTSIDKVNEVISMLSLIMFCRQ